MDPTVDDQEATDRDDVPRWEMTGEISWDRTRGHPAGVSRGSTSPAMLLMRGLVVTALLCSTALASDYPQPERRAQANVVTSGRDPKIRIELPPAVQYVGADRWPLLNIADCELHLFVEASPQKKVQRLYWVQFEAYLPSLPDLHHTYPFTKTDTLGGLLFDVRARFGPGADTPKAGSDSEHVQAMLRAKGFQMPEGTMNVRFVHLLDQQKRKELMIIYVEDLAPAGLTVDDLMPGGKHAAEWPSIQAALIERAKKRVTIYPE
jgi:hypothetical protein